MTVNFTSFPLLLHIQLPEHCTRCVGLCLYFQWTALFSAIQHGISILKITFFHSDLTHGSYNLWPLYEKQSRLAPAIRMCYKGIENELSSTVQLHNCHRSNRPCIRKVWCRARICSVVHFVMIRFDIPNYILETSPTVLPATFQPAE